MTIPDCGMLLSIGRGLCGDGVRCRKQEEKQLDQKHTSLIVDFARTRNASTASGSASRKSSGRPPWRRPRSSRAPLGGGAAPKSRRCLPMSGAAKRSSFSRNHRRQAHRGRRRRRRRRGHSEWKIGSARPQPFSYTLPSFPYYMFAVFRLLFLRRSGPIGLFTSTRSMRGYSDRLNRIQPWEEYYLLNYHHHHHWP